MQIAEENYLKAIFSLTRQAAEATTNAIAELLDTKASSVTDMVKRLAEKKLVHYKKYKGVSLTDGGRRVALKTIRKHRLWEVFLVEHLHFGWEEVHEVAEQLEHIQSEKLTNSLDDFLGSPKFDPHGDPIPDRDGIMAIRKASEVLSESKIGEKVKVVGVKDTSTMFLQYLDSQEIGLGTLLQVIEFFEFDGSVKLKVNGDKELIVSKMVASNLFVSN